MNTRWRVAGLVLCCLALVSGLILLALCILDPEARSFMGHVVIVVCVLAVFLGPAVIGSIGSILGKLDEPDRLRKRRRAKGLCENCGYNLKGNISGKCPECGWSIPEEMRPRVDE